VDQDIHGARERRGRTGQRMDGPLVADVGGEHVGRPALGANPPRDRLQIVGTTGRHHDPGAAPRQLA